MTEETCNRVANLLVEYADGELSGADADRVAAHLAECPGCQAELRLLQRSLELAQTIWQGTVPIFPQGKWDCPPPNKLGRRRIQVAIGVAACLALLAAAATPWLFTSGESDSQVTDRAENTTEPEPQQIKAPQPVEDFDIETFIARAGRRARLAASAELLATQPGLKEYKEQAERYLAEAYNGTPDLGPAATPSVPPPAKEPES
jgi:hypothetical protein